jgi:hypothetical protein
VSFGISRGSKFVTLGKVSVQPKATSSFASIVTTPSEASAKASPVSTVFSKVDPGELFSQVAGSKKTSVRFSSFDFGIIKEFPIFRRDDRFNDSLPTVSAKFTAYEELSGISSTRPEIIAVSEFKPLYSDNNATITPSGEFLDAQVKLMNLRQQALISLINDMKKDKQLADQLVTQEEDFLLHIRNLKTRVEFLQTVQGNIERVSKLFDTRDPSLKVDIKTLLLQYYRQVFSDINAAAAEFPLYGYSDLLALHGFSKNRTLSFSGTKIYLQTLNEAKKMLRAGSDEFLGIDPSLTSNDSDPVKLNRRDYKDPHVELSKAGFPSLSDIVSLQINDTDANLASAVNQLSNGFVGMDSAFSNATSEEITYSKKILVLTREFVYSKALSDPTTIDLLKKFGYSVGESLGNQQLFDAVYGQIGNRITDDRSNVNQSTLSSVASKTTNNTSVLTFEADYLNNDDGSTFTPGSSFYISSVVRPSDNGFSLSNPAELVTRMNGVVDKYIDFLGKFNILPKVSSQIVAQDSANLLASDPITMLNSLYQMYVEPSTGIIKSDVVDDPMVSFLSLAATDLNLRANLLLYFYCAANLAGDGLSTNLPSLLGVGDIAKIAKASATLDKLINNCVLRYKLITGDVIGDLTIQKSLKNFNEKAILSRVISFISQLTAIHKNENKAFTSKGVSRYSLVSDLGLVALGLQIILDSARRYVNVKTQQNFAFNVNANYSSANSKLLSKAQSTLRQVTTQKFANSIVKAATSSGVETAKSNTVVASDRLFSKAPLKQSVESRLKREDDLAVKTAFAPLNLVKVCRDALEQFVLSLSSKDSVSTLNDIMRVVGDRKLVELLGERGQVQMLTDILDDVLSRVDPSSSSNSSTTNIVDVTTLGRATGDPDDLKMFDDSLVTSVSVDALKAALADSTFSAQRGSNIRLISVGLPHGFSSKLRNIFKISSFAEQVNSKLKQNDVVVLDVYKIDVRYPDLVFKSTSKVFELSRFAVRDEKQIASVNVGSGLNKALDSIPTKDYSNISNPQVSRGVDRITADANYDFMSKDDCQSMVRNHTLSYVLELYFRLMTGIPASERELYISDPDEKDQPASFITKMILTHTADKVFEVPIKPNYSADLSRFGIISDKEVNRNLPSKSTNALDLRKIVGDRDLPGPVITDVINHVRAASDAGSKSTVYSDAEQTSKRLLSPKLFERIFWLAIDPDDYEIDYEETMSSPVGQSTFSKLRQAGEIEVKTEMVGLYPREVYKMRDLKTTQQELVFEKYFTTVRSYTSLGLRKL